MENQLIAYLLDLALKNNIGFYLSSELSPDTPSFADPSRQFILINTNWRYKKELPFQIAHEISHILNDDAGILYYSTPASKRKIESNANDTAIHILLDYAGKTDINYQNPCDFMETFGIPDNLMEQVADYYLAKI